MDSDLYYKYLDEVKTIATENSRVAASAVMERAFTAAVAAKPRLIVELGTGVTGIRTQAICRAAALFGAKIVSVDIKDCSACGNDWYENWSFVKEDARNLDAVRAAVGEALDQIDVLIVDLDEKYDTTQATWALWSPLLSEQAIVMFRCTNLKKRLAYEDGSSTNLGWDNDRGVIRVIENILDMDLDENREFLLRSVSGSDGFLYDVDHYPWGAGLTILRRVQK